jgi:hypothetical protein
MINKGKKLFNPLGQLGLPRRDELIKLTVQWLPKTSNTRCRIFLINRSRVVLDSQLQHSDPSEDKLTWQR